MSLVNTPAGPIRHRPGRSKAGPFRNRLQTPWAAPRLRLEKDVSGCGWVSCPICSHAAGRPDAVLAELPATWVTAPTEAPLPGSAWVVAKRHVVEPYDLVDPDRALFWDDCLLVARALSDLFQPIKMNYEIHGNTVPHLHMHLYPRYVGDPYEGGPIDNRARFTRTAEEIERIRRALELECTQSRPPSEPPPAAARGEDVSGDCTVA